MRTSLLERPFDFMDVRRIRHQDGPCCGIAQKRQPVKKHLRQIGAFAILLPRVAFRYLQLARVVSLKCSIRFLDGEDE